jgi:thiol-disulfide isomerase/thioredoxin
MNRIFFATLLCLLVPPSVASQTAMDTKTLEGQIAAPEFPDGLDWLNTEAPIKLRNLRGKFVLLDFWTFCCINCMHVIPDLKRLEAKYPEELVVIGVHSAKFQNEKDTDQIRQAVLRYGVRHPVVNDANFQIWRSYAVKAWPTLVLINPRGKLIASLSGEGIYEPFSQALTLAIPYFASKGELTRGSLKTTLEVAARPETLLSYPGKVSSDEKSKRLFISDSNHNRILITTPEGKILDVIGSGDEGRRDGSFEDAEFHHPQGTFLEKELLYIADTENHLVRCADLRTRAVKTVLGTGEQASQMNVSGTGLAVALNSPWDLLIQGGKIYIAMAGSHQIWVADTKGNAQPYAGSGRENIADGPRLQAALAQTSGLTTDGKAIYFADSETSSIRAVDLWSEGGVSTLVGKGLFEFGDKDGNCADARLQHPLGVAVHQDLLFVADTYNSKIKVIDPEKCTSLTFAGDGAKTIKNGSPRDASFNEPGGLTWLQDKLYVADTNNHVVRIVDPHRKQVSTLELSSIEKLSGRKRNRFEGRPVTLKPVEVQPGITELAISISLPAGYKFNKDAPFFLEWTPDDSNILSLGAQPKDFDLHAPNFPLSVPVARLQAKSSLRIDAIVYYCTTEGSACLVDRIQASLELQPVERGPKSVPVDLQVRKADKI